MRGIKTKFKIKLAEGQRSTKIEGGQGSEFVESNAPKRGGKIGDQPKSC